MRPAPLRALLATASATVLAATLLATTGASAAPAASGAAPGQVAVGADAPLSAKRNGGNPVTPGDFFGYGFDQCLAPTQRSMNKWLHHSPFLAVGIYISGDSRACRNQPNLTPRWISTQLRKGWRLLPITLGPQASCQPRFPRYHDDYKINPRPGRNAKYRAARRMGNQEAEKTVADAKALGIAEGSTLWYDMEGFDINNRDCRESALAFISGWTRKLHRLGYVSGVYSSAGSGIKALDDARVQRPREFNLPDRIWVARWDGKANTSTSYLRDDAWRPGNRVKQYQGGHDEVWGGVRINIDRNFLDLGNGRSAPREEHCGGTNIDFRNYQALHPPRNGKVSPRSKVRALQCLLRENGSYRGQITGRYNKNVVAAVRDWRERKGFRVGNGWSRAHWMTLLSHGRRPVLKFGSTGTEVRRLQRTLNAADPRNKLRIRGVFNRATDRTLRRYQARTGVDRSGVANNATWPKLKHGKR